MAPQEWEAAQRDFGAFDGYLGDQFNTPFSVVEVPIDRTEEMPIVGPSVDLFGDGSVWVFVMPGHTSGELAAMLNTTAGPWLFTFDVSHLRANFENDVKPGFTVDAEAARANLHRLITFAAAYPQMRVFFGHEPDQWDAAVPSLLLTAPPSVAVEATEAR